MSTLMCACYRGRIRQVCCENRAPNSDVVVVDITEDAIALDFISTSSLDEVLNNELKKIFDNGLKLN